MVGNGRFPLTMVKLSYESSHGYIENKTDINATTESNARHGSNDSNNNNNNNNFYDNDNNDGDDDKYNDNNHRIDWKAGDIVVVSFKHENNNVFRPCMIDSITYIENKQDHQLNIEFLDKNERKIVMLDEVAISSLDNHLANHQKQLKQQPSGDGRGGPGVSNPAKNERKDIKCICGESMVEKDCTTVYFATLWCDACRKTMGSVGTMVWHCPRGTITACPQGYDLCETCATINNTNNTTNNNSNNNNNNSNDNNNNINNTGEWGVLDEKTNKFHVCPRAINNKFNSINVGESTLYTIGRWNYRGKKLTPDLIEQTNIKTQRKRKLIKNGTSCGVNFNPNGNKNTNKNRNRGSLDVVSTSTHKQTIVNGDLSRKEIASEFHETMLPSEFTITSIEDLTQEHGALKRYESIYNEILNYKENKEEKFVFHGTGNANVNEIIQNGFNRDFNTRAKYGKGVYFARDADMSVGFCDSGIGNELGMFVCKIIMGDCCVGKEGMTIPPFKPDGIDQYEMMVDDLDNPTIYVVTKDYHALPKYLITFERK